MSEPVRLHRFIAQCGVCSRRKAEELIANGHVTVNGECVTQLGTKVTDADIVIVDGREIKPERHVYVSMNKPKGFVTTMSDERGRRTVADLLPDFGVVVKPVGRLDKDTEGLLLFTNDGELAKRMTHPSHSMEKQYEAVVFGIPDQAALDKLRNGVVIERRKTRPADVKLVKTTRNSATLKITLREGRKRQIRLMCDSVGYPVKTLKRIRFGPLTLRGMRPGECRLLDKATVERLLQESKR